MLIDQMIMAKTLIMIIQQVKLKMDSGPQLLSAYQIHPPCGDAVDTLAESH